jgi:hypothetical protein
MNTKTTTTLTSRPQFYTRTLSTNEIYSTSERAENIGEMRLVHTELNVVNQSRDLL